MNLTSVGVTPLIILTTGALAACRPAPIQTVTEDYRVTTAPLQIGEGIGLCIALDLADRQGVRWWMPGETGCDSRSSGPDLFKAEAASISVPTPTGSSTIAFRVGTHSTSRPFIDIQLVLEGDMLRVLETGAQVLVRRTAHLDIPEIPTRGRRQR